MGTIMNGAEDTDNSAAVRARARIESLAGWVERQTWSKRSAFYLAR